MYVKQIDINRNKKNTFLKIKLPCSGNSKEMSTSQTKAINIGNKTENKNIQANHTKSMPKPILKKPKESQSFSNYTNKKNLTSPTFYSGNEAKFSSYEETIENYDNRKENDQDENSSGNNSDGLEDLEKSELKDEFIDQINFSKINLNYYKQHYKHDDRFTLSSLVKPRSLTKPHKLTPRKRTQSEVYVYHSKDINKEIIKMLIQSTNNFINDFKIKNQCPHTKDTELIKCFRQKFTNSLKEYLLHTSDHYYDRSHHLDIGVTLSEPLISEIEECRAKTETESKLTASHSESLFYQNFFTNSIDSSGNVKNETHIYGSLPTTSFFDLYAPKAPNQSGISSDASSKILTRKKNAKEKNKNIVNEASTNKKIVRFADSFGLELEKVKMITNNSFVDAFSLSNEYDDDPFKPKQTEPNNINTKEDSFSKPFLVLIPLFGLRKQEAILRLDDYVYDYENKLIRCIIKVRNLHYVKRVYARITFNNWKTHYDMDAMYIKSDPPPSSPYTHIHHLHTHGSGGGSSSNLVLHGHTKPYNYDYFGFCILLPEKNDQTAGSTSRSTNSPSLAFDDCTLRVEFALCYQWDSGKNTTWDNNCGENYKFQCFYNK